MIDRSVITIHCSKNTTYLYLMFKYNDYFLDKCLSLTSFVWVFSTCMYLRHVVEHNNTKGVMLLFA